MFAEPVAGHAGVGGHSRPSPRTRLHLPLYTPALREFRPLRWRRFTVIVGFRALPFMPSLLGCRHRTPDGVQRTCAKMVTAGRSCRGQRISASTDTHPRRCAMHSRGHPPKFPLQAAYIALTKTKYYPDA